MVSVGSTATAVADLVPPLRTDISPKQSPGASKAMSFSRPSLEMIEIFTIPSATKCNRSPGSSW